MLLTLWVLGDLILGILVLLTRGNKVIIEESSTTFGGPSSPSSPSMFNLERIDERIAQLKAERAVSPAPTPATPMPQGFGRRRA